jgi:hypothetical protein
MGGLVIDETDLRLVRWVEGVLDRPRVSLSLPAGGEAAGVNIYLLDLEQEPLPRGSKKPPLQVALRYLVTVGDEDLAQAHRHLWKLLVDAAGRAEANHWTVEREPPPLELWRALGLTPRPSFVMRVQARHEWEQLPPAKRVERREFQGGPVRSLSGIVYASPGETPVSGAVVDLPALGQSVETDRRGRFTFPAVPGGDFRPKKIVVRARGHRQDVDVPADAGAGPLMIELHFAEV